MKKLLSTAKESCFTVNIQINRDVGRSENLVGGGHNLPPPPVEIALADLPKSRGCTPPPSSPDSDTPGLRSHADAVLFDEKQNSFFFCCPLLFFLTFDYL